MKKKVLHLIASNAYSGAENMICTIINNCSDKYDMYYCSLNGPIKEVLEKKNIKFIPLKRLSIKSLKKIIKDYNIDIIHAHDYQASVISVFLNIKTISHIHCDYNLLWCSFFVSFIYSIVQRKIDKIVVVSKEILDNASFGKKIANKTVIINNVVDAKTVIDKSIEFESTSYDLVFVGRLVDVKNPELVIEVTKRLKEKYSKIKTCIIGAGNLEEKCKKLIREYNLEDNIDMLGFRSNPFPYIKNSKVMVLPSKYEGFGLVAVEAMILGVSVVNSGVGGLKTIFKDYPMYIADNLDDYVEVIDNLLNSDKDNYKDDCNLMIKKFIDVDYFKNKFIKIYEELLK